MQDGLIIDLFCGAGGWDVGLCSVDPSLHDRCVGFEVDARYCRTRAAAGHRTVCADVSQYPVELLAGRVEGLIASPPCTSWSAAGKKDGLASESGRLVWEPTRWAHALRPRWVACEQVREAMPAFQHIARDLEDLGYFTWVGLLNCADYGLPQSRVRCFLIANIDGPVEPPLPTHGRESQPPDLFGREIKRWVSLEDATGLSGYLSTGAKSYVVSRAKADKVWYERACTEPAPTVTGALGGAWVVRDEPMPDGRYAALENAKRTLLAVGDRLIDEPVVEPEELVEEPQPEGPFRSARVEGATKLTLAQGSVLQGFPPDYPWQGTQQDRWQQLGNAVPPPVAALVVQAAMRVVPHL